MSNLRIEPVLCRAGTMDNYAWLLTDEETGQSAVVDPSEAAPIIARCKELGIKPQYIFNTHHHYDHTDANLELKALYGAQVVGGAADLNRIPGIDIGLNDGDTFSLGSSRAEIIRADGHTIGHILWYFPEAKALFTGDTLFRGSCGRTDLPGGNMRMEMASLKRLCALPGDYEVYPGHMDSSTLERERRFNHYCREAMTKF